MSIEEWWRRRSQTDPSKWDINTELPRQFHSLDKTACLDLGKHCLIAAFDRAPMGYEETLYFVAMSALAVICLTTGRDPKDVWERFLEKIQEWRPFAK